MSSRKTNIRRFDEMAVLVKDKIDNPAEADVDRYVGLEHLDPDSLKIRRWGVPTDVEASKLVFKSGDIIFGKRRVYQRKLAVADFDGICSAHAMVLRSKPEVALPEFLPFFMQSDLFMERALEISVGSLSPTINWKTLAKQEFSLPPLEEQRRIAKVLKAAERATECLRILSEQARISWLSFLESLQRDQRLEPRSLGELLDNIKPGRSVVGSDKAPRETELAVLKVSAVDPMGFQPKEAKVLLDPSDFMPELCVKDGDLLMTRSNTPALVGETCIVSRDYPNLMLCDKTLRLVPNESVNKKLLWHLMQSQSMRQQLTSVATGTGGAMKNISQAKIKALRVPFSTHSDVARSICQALDRCFQTAAIAVRRCSDANILKTMLLDRLIEVSAQ